MLITKAIVTQVLKDFTFDLGSLNTDNSNGSVGFLFIK